MKNSGLIIRLLTLLGFCDIIPIELLRGWANTGNKKREICQILWNVLELREWGMFYFRKFHAC